MTESLALKAGAQPSPEAAKAAGSSSVKLHIGRAELLRAITHVQSVVERRTTIPILSHVKLEAEDGTLRLTATDMDIAITEEVKANIETEGSLTVSAQTFYDIVRKLPDGAEIDIEGGIDHNGKLRIRSGSCDFSLSVLDAADFPAMDKGELPFIFKLSATDCITLIEKPRFAISTEETRYYLNGIYFHAARDDKKSSLRAVATDGHRLARVEIDQPAGAAGIPGVIIPRKAVLELKKLIEQGVDEVTVSLSENKIRFEIGSAILLSKLIDGTFPDYEKVIPSSNDKLMEVEVSKLAQAVDRVSIIAQDKLRVVRFQMQEGKLTLSSASQESGTATEELQVNYTSDPIEIGFNSRYLLEMLSQIEGDVAQFLFSSNTSPTLVRDTANTKALYVVMPMRV